MKIHFTGTEDATYLEQAARERFEELFQPGSPGPDLFESLLPFKVVFTLLDGQVLVEVHAEANKLTMKIHNGGFVIIDNCI